MSSYSTILRIRQEYHNMLNVGKLFATIAPSDYENLIRLNSIDKATATAPAYF